MEFTEITCKQILEIYKKTYSVTILTQFLVNVVDFYFYVALRQIKRGQRSILSK